MDIHDPQRINTHLIAAMRAKVSIFSFWISNGEITYNLTEHLHAAQKDRPPLKRPTKRPMNLSVNFTGAQRMNQSFHLISNTL